MSPAPRPKAANSLSLIAKKSSPYGNHNAASDLFARAAAASRASTKTLPPWAEPHAPGGYPPIERPAHSLLLPFLEKTRAGDSSISFDGKALRRLGRSRRRIGPCWHGGCSSDSQRETPVSRKPKRPAHKGRERKQS